MDPVLLAVAGFLLLAYLVAWFLMREPRGRPVELRRALAEGAIVLDVRSPEEFRQGHHPAARNVPMDELRGRATELGDRDRPVIVYCASGMRSRRAVRILKEAGFQRVLDAGALRAMPRMPDEPTNA